MTEVQYANETPTRINNTATTRSLRVSNAEIPAAFLRSPKTHLCDYHQFWVSGEGFRVSNKYVIIVCSRIQSWDSMWLSLLEGYFDKHVPICTSIYIYIYYIRRGTAVGFSHLRPLAGMNIGNLVVVLCLKLL